MNENLTDITPIEFINIITVKPKYQQHIVDNITGFLEMYAKKQPGFMSAKIATSFDGSRIVYSIRWKTQEDSLAWQKMVEDALQLLKSEVEDADYRLYKVVEDISL